MTTALLLKIGAGVALTGLASVGGFNYFTTGCLLGTCSSEADVTLTSAAAPAAEKADSCCAGGAVEPVVTLVAGAATEQAAEACEEKKAGGCCGSESGSENLVDGEAPEATTEPVAAASGEAPCCSGEKPAEALVQESTETPAEG